jgi:hypothetical protein
MKYMFFLIVLVVTIALNGYVFIRGWQVLPPFLLPKILYSILFWGLTATFFVRMYKGDAFSPSVSMALSRHDFAFVPIEQWYGERDAHFESIELWSWRQFIPYLCIYAVSKENIKFRNPFGFGSL